MVPGSTLTTLPSVIIAASVGMADEWVGIGLRFVLKSNKGPQPNEKPAAPPAIPTDLPLIRQLSSLATRT